MAAAIQVDVQGVEALGARLRALGDAAPKAVLRALKRTRVTLMTRVGRSIAKTSGLPVRRVRKSLHGTQPTYGDPSLTLTLWGGRDQLIRYARAVQRAALPPSAFRAKMPGGHVGYFERRPGRASLRPMPGRAVSKRLRPGVWHTLPIDEVYGPPLTAFLTDAELAALLQAGGEIFRANLEHEITFREGQGAA